MSSKLSIFIIHKKDPNHEYMTRVFYSYNAGDKT